MARGDIIVLARGRDPDTTFEYPPFESSKRPGYGAKEAVREFKERKLEEGWQVVLSRPDTCVVEKDGVKDTTAYYLFDPVTFQRRVGKDLLSFQILREDLRPENL